MKKGKSRLYVISVLSAIIAISAALCVCTVNADENDVNCIIGMTSSGSTYTATIVLPDKDWKYLSKEQKQNVIDQCYCLIDLNDPGKDVTLKGKDKKTGETLFDISNRHGA